MGRRRTTHPAGSGPAECAEPGSRNRSAGPLRREQCFPDRGPCYAQSLERGLADAEAAHRPDTTLRRDLQVVGRLEAFRPVTLTMVEAPAFPAVLPALEAGLRKCIEDRLSSLAPNWWVDRVLDEIRCQAERRQANR